MWRQISLALVYLAVPCVSTCVTPTSRPAKLPTSQQTSRGPKSGSLVVVGGHAASKDIFDRVLSLAGGEHAVLAYVPTNSGSNYDSQTTQERELESFKKLAGWSNLNVRWVHTYDRSEADTDSFAAQLDNVTGIWFAGGRQWHCADAYLDTKAEKAFQGVLVRGGVISGSSAGASIQGDFLVRGDTKNNWKVIGDHTKGFGYATNVGFDQHFLKRNREWDMIELVEAHPEILGIAIDENTAIVVQGDEFEVIGENYVAITDGTLWSDVNYCANYELTDGRGRPRLAHQGKFFFLKAHGTGNKVGDKYNIRTREVVRQNFDEDDNLEIAI